ncbi:hypothetical protein HD554DRAFT_2037221 [Boletus coccyginus]|nr:hypothetical protein HD554DRAFT_2037221 [Boletus coccyginus]
MACILLAFLGRICCISAFVTTVAGLRLGSQHIGHLFAFWGCMTGSSCVVTLFGLYSARNGGTSVSFWRVVLLVLLPAHIMGGLALLSDEFSLCYALDWTYVNVTTQAGNLGREQGSIFADFKRWVASMPTIPLFSHGPEQRATQLASTYEMSKLGGPGNLQALFSRMVQSRHRFSTECDRQRGMRDPQKGAPLERYPEASRGGAVSEQETTGTIEGIDAVSSWKPTNGDEDASCLMVSISPNTLQPEVDLTVHA